MTVKSKDACANIAKHTPCPDDYLQWHYWAEKKAKTHHQVRCPGCGLLVIWVKTKGVKQS